MTNTEHTHAGWQFWLYWVLANMVGWAIGEALASFVPENTILIGSLHMAVIGAAGGIAQWFILRRQLEGVGGWILATCLAMAVSGAIGLAASFAAGADLLQPWAVLILGFAIGIGQWLILRQHVSQAGWWVLVNTLGLPVGFVLGLVIAFSLGFEWENVGEVFRVVSLTLFGAVAGAIIGAITGSVLVWLLRQPARTPKQVAVVTPGRL